jgi:predicted metal-dependent enzyme (double-stranded beta helix superfamily)
MTTATLDIDALVDDCRAALAADQPQLAVRDVLDRTLADPAAVAATLGRERGGLESLHTADDLTVLNVVWTPGMRLYPHDHRMWAVIGIYGGIEDNEFFRRTPEGLTPSGGKQAHERDVLVLGDDVIHAVSNTHSSKFTGAIHVYGGNFFTRPRSEWDPETGEERAFDVDSARKVFADANERFLGTLRDT